MKQLNLARLAVTSPCKNVDILKAYNVLTQTHGWHTATHRKQFPLQRFQRHLRTSFPESGNLVVSKDRSSWRCYLCADVGQNLNDGHVYHKQNVTKHFLSEEHCKMVASTTSTATTITNGVNHFRQLQIYESNLASAIRDDAVLSCARKSLSFSAVPVVMEVAARAVIVCKGKEPIPNYVFIPENLIFLKKYIFFMIVIQI